MGAQILYIEPAATMNGYQDLARRSARQLPREAWRVNGALGLAGEAGEIADRVKKEAYHDHPVDDAAMLKELGDLLWYVALVAWAYGLTLEEVAAANVAKLRGRYPEGFDAARSINRQD